jgi:ureidoglycolate lyase
MTAERRICARPLDRDAFAHYGDAFDVRSGMLAAGQLTPINAGTGIRHDDLTHLDLQRDGGSPCITVFETAGDAHYPPYRLREFERHRLGSQSFVPLADSRCLVVVALGQDEPDLDTLRAFVVEPGQGATIRADVWHHPLLSIRPARVLVLERRAKTTDCDVVPLADPIVVDLPGSRLEPDGVP